MMHQVMLDSKYHMIVVETYLNEGENSASEIRVRAVAGQGISTALHVECDKDFRPHHPIGTLFHMKLKLSGREGTPMLYSYYGWKPKVLSFAEAKKLIEQNPFT